MYKYIRCMECYKYFPYPKEWLEHNASDQGYLEDGFYCEHCQNVKDQENYYRNGMAELNGY